MVTPSTQNLFFWPIEHPVPNDFLGHMAYRELRLLKRYPALLV